MFRRAAATVPARPSGRAVAVGAAVAVVVGLLLGLPVRNLAGAAPRDLGDPLLNVWALSWESTALARDVGALYDANIYWPGSTSIAYSESMLPLLPVFAVLRVLTGSALAAATLLSYLLVLGAVAAAYALAARYVRNRSAALVAGLSYGVGGYVLAHASHLQLLTLGSFPLVFLLLFRIGERPGWRRALACGAAIAAGSLASLYYGVLLAPCLVAMVLVLVALSGRWRRRSTLGAVALAAVVAGVLTAPGLLPYRLLDGREGLYRPVVPQFDLELADLVTPPPETSLYGGLSDRLDGAFGWNEHTMFPGFVALGLAAVGLAALATPRLRRSLGPDRGVEVAALLAAAVVAVVLALGAEAGGVTLPFRWLHDHVPGYGGIRATARFVVPALLVLGVLAAIGLDAVARRVPRVPAEAIVGAAVVVLVAELWAPVPWVRLDRDDDVVAVYDAIDERPDGVVVELPMANPWPAPGTGPSLTWERTEPARMVRSLRDGNPRVNGYSGHHPLGYFEAVQAFNSFPGPDALARIDDLDVRYVVLHLGPAADGQPQYDDEAVEAILDDLPAGWTAEQHGRAWLLERP